MGVYGASVQNQPGTHGADDNDAFDGGTGGSAEEAAGHAHNSDGSNAGMQ